MIFFRKIKRKLERQGGRSPATDSDALFSLSSAYITLELKMGLYSTGKAAVCIKNISGMQFTDLKNEIRSFLDLSSNEFDITYRMTGDSFGYLWIMIFGNKMESLLAASAAVSDTVDERGLGSQLLAAMFEFSKLKPSSNFSDSSRKIRENENNGRNYYLVYNYKRNNFYPFVPANTRTRSTEEELRLMSSVKDEIPFESNLTLWYPLWDIPL